jgi:hypothetical protein
MVNVWIILVWHGCAVVDGRITDSDSPDSDSPNPNYFAILTGGREDPKIFYLDLNHFMICAKLQNKCKIENLRDPVVFI